jgi:peroxiredoxin
MGPIRALATDAERGKVVTKLAADIRALPAGREKLSLASSLSNLATEGDLGKEALNGVAATLAQALHETEGAVGNYVELAKLIRYEHVAPPPADPALDAATALLELRDQVLQETGFTLTALDGKVYNLDALRGHVVLLNFWATWCPPCRKEMPDMQKLYERFEKKGFLVLAVSDEKRETVEGFLAKQNYTFPILLDPDRKTNTAFYVEGIPKSFLFDRQGRLVAQSIDMRTESQFLEMFKAAGLE